MRALIIWCHNINLLLVVYWGFVLEKVQRPLYTFGGGRDMVTPKGHSSGEFVIFFWLCHFQKKQETKALKIHKKTVDFAIINTPKYHQNVHESRDIGVSL